jgi:hypothetical protein
MNPEGGPRLMANAFSLAQQMQLNPEDWQCAYSVGGCKDCMNSNCTRVRDPANPNASEARMAQLNAFVDELSRFAMVTPDEMQAEFSIRAQNPLLADVPLPQSKVLQARLGQNLRQNPSGKLHQNRTRGEDLGFSMGTAKLLGSFLGQEKEPSGQGKDSEIKKTFVKAVTQCLGDNQWGTVLAEQEIYYRKLAKKLCSEEPNLYRGSDADFVEAEIAGRAQNTLFVGQDLASIRSSSAQLEVAKPSELLGSDFAKGNQSFVVPTIFNSDGGTSSFDVLLNQARSKKAASWIDRVTAGVSSLVDGSLVRGGDPRWLACRAITARHSTYLSLITTNEATKSNWIRVQKDADRRLLGLVAPEPSKSRSPAGH